MYALDALGAGGLGFEVAAAGELGGDVEGRVAVGLPAFAITQDAEAGIEHGAIAKTLLVANIGQPGEDVVIVGALLGRERGDAFVGRVVVVGEQPGAEAVARVRVGLELKEVAAADEVIGVGVGGQLGNVDVAVLGVEGFEEPAVCCGRWGRRR